MERVSVELVEGSDIGDFIREFNMMSALSGILAGVKMEEGVNILHFYKIEVVKLKKRSWFRQLLSEVFSWRS